MQGRGKLQCEGLPLMPQHGAQPSLPPLGGSSAVNIHHLSSKSFATGNKHGCGYTVWVKRLWWLWRWLLVVVVVVVVVVVIGCGGGCGGCGGWRGCGWLVEVVEVGGGGADRVYMENLCR